MEGPASVVIETGDVIEDESEEQCCVCLDHIANTIISPCKHKLCLECAIPIYESVKQCPLCRGELRYILSNLECGKPATASDYASIFGKSPDLFKYIMKGVNKITVAKNLAEFIKDIGSNIEGYISLDEAEILLKTINDKGIMNYVIKNAIVKLCNQPWAVDPALGGSGVCYFGNLGEKPTLNDGLFILRKNRKDIDKFGDDVD